MRLMVGMTRAFPAMPYTMPWQTMSCGTVFANDAPTSDAAMIGTLAQRDHLRALGHLWKPQRKSGIVKYMTPVDVVPMAAMPPWEAKGSFDA
jgi:hypothetical protein